MQEQYSRALPRSSLSSNSWLTRRDMPYERWALATAVVQTAAGHSILYATADILPAA